MPGFGTKCQKLGLHGLTDVGCTGVHDPTVLRQDMKKQRTPWAQSIRTTGQRRRLEECSMAKGTLKDTE